MPPKTPAPGSRLSDNDDDDLPALINDAIAGHTRSLREAMQSDRSAMLEALRQDRAAMQESLIVSLQQLFPRTATSISTHPDTTQAIHQSSQSGTQSHQPNPSTSAYPGTTQPSSGYTLQSSLGGYEANPAAQAAAFGQPAPHQTFQPPLGPPHPFPPATPRTRSTPIKLGPTVSYDTSRATSPPSPLKRASLEPPMTTSKKTRTSPRKTPGDKQPGRHDPPTLRSAHPSPHPKSTGQG
ncbi:conserved hypothetical protein [Ixodes scapularis]|uniref:Uncharacterized protein n=1 Tax=Ixodes scapularis TaxID=6945 RepID=B7PFZ7_IXOSC|nr:conserved hypothetical protein [Ixodes scapularis]|eukprot:XP_002434119.1 conserved hypothetical protein [Ixodes scapularis]